MSLVGGPRDRPPLPATFHDLTGKSVFVTGGGSGIGAALTDGFLAQGAKVFFVQRSDATGFCDEMERKHRTRPQFQPCDVTDIPALRAALDRASQINGRIDVLVNNAANDQRHKTEDVTEEFWDWSTGINLKSYFFAAQAVIGPMKTAGCGAIVNFSSVAYMTGMAGFPLYVASNAAIVSLTQTMAREFGRDGIRINAVAPGMVVTPRQEELWLTPEGMQTHIDQQSLPQVIVPQDLVGTVLFLASDTSRMVTGQTVIVDGGFIARS